MNIQKNTHTGRGYFTAVPGGDSVKDNNNLPKGFKTHFTIVGWILSKWKKDLVFKDSQAGWVNKKSAVHYLSRNVAAFDNALDLQNLNDCTQVDKVKTLFQKFSSPQPANPPVQTSSKTSITEPLASEKFKDTVQNGRIERLFESGMIFDAEDKNDGVLNGEGGVAFSDDPREIYTAKFKDDLLIEKRVAVTDFFPLFFHNLKRNPIGKLLCGEFTNGKLNGEGKAYVTGAIESFDQDLQSKEPFVTIVEGFFKDDKLNGNGKITFGEPFAGFIMEGDFIDDRIITGTLRIPPRGSAFERFFEGTFNENCHPLEGTMQYSIDSKLSHTYRGNFHNVHPVGDVEVIYPDGRIEKEHHKPSTLFD